VSDPTQPRPAIGRGFLLAPQSSRAIGFQLVDWRRSRSVPLTISTAVREVARTPWPPRAVGFRLLDHDGREVLRLD
jgi:hypothetical protein